jgi:hypothetical protein
MTSQAGLVFSALQKAGVGADELLELARAQFGRGAGGVSADVAANAIADSARNLPGSSKRELIKDILIGLASAGGGALAASAPSIVESIVRPPAIGGGGGSESRYMIGPETDLRLIPDYRADVFRTRLLNLIPGIDLPMPRAPQEILGDIEARITRQARDLTIREIEKRRAEREFDIALGQIEAQKAIQQAQIQAAGGIRRQEIQSGADVRSRELESLSDVQRERLRSSYDFAKGALESAIENVLQSGVVTDRSVQQELARIQ